MLGTGMQGVSHSTHGSLWTGFRRTKKTTRPRPHPSCSPHWFSSPYTSAGKLFTDYAHDRRMRRRSCLRFKMTDWLSALFDHSGYFYIWSTWDRDLPDNGLSTPNIYTVHSRDNMFFVFLIRFKLPFYIDNLTLLSHSKRNKCITCSHFTISVFVYSRSPFPIAQRWTILI